jgi:hypothetical protein
MKFALTKKTFALVAALDVNRGYWLAIARIETSEGSTGLQRNTEAEKRKNRRVLPRDFAPVFYVLPVSEELRPLISLFGPKLDPLVTAARNKMQWVNILVNKKAVPFVYCVNNQH